MRSTAIAGAVSIVALGAAVLVIGVHAPAGGSLNPQIAVVPTLREWQTSAGNFKFQNGSRIVIDSADAGALAPTAEALREDLLSLTGMRLGVVQGGQAMPGDLFVTLATNDAEIGSEGYVLDIGVVATIRAHTPAGVFYGSRSLLQILLSGHSSSLPHGLGRDYPRYAERGFMLDVSSQFVPVSVLKRYVRYLAWYKYNDFQLELNDNGGFRLNSPDFPGLAAGDGSYTETEFKDLERYALVRGIAITPEIDSPGHAAALIRYRPELANPVNRNFINLADPQTYSYMASLWSAFLPWFTGPRIAIGADEYDTADGDSYRRYVNFLDDVLRRHGKSVRMWGSLSRESGGVAVRTDITLQEWDTGWSNPMAMDRLGFPIINSSSEFLYIVTPKTPWFADHMDAPNIYERWEPTMFSRNDETLNLPPGDPRLQGAMFAFWGEGATQDTFNRVRAAMPVVGEKLWNDASAKVPYPLFDIAVKNAAEVPEALS